VINESQLIWIKQLKPSGGLLKIGRGAPCEKPPRLRGSTRHATLGQSKAAVDQPDQCEEQKEDDHGSDDLGVYRFGSSAPLVQSRASEFQESCFHASEQPQPLTLVCLTQERVRPFGRGTFF